LTKPQTLCGAILTWGAPVAVAEMTRLEKEGWEAPLSFVGGRETESDRQSARYRSIRVQLEVALIEDLRQGKLIASGYDSRAAIDALAVVIPPDRWRVLVPNFEDSSATANGVTIIGILIAAADPAGSQVTVRLRLKQRQREIYLDGEKRSIAEQPFKVLWLLAEKARIGGGYVPTREIDAQIWGDNARLILRQSRDVIRELRDALSRGRVDVDEIHALILASGKKSYRLCLAPEEIALEP